MKVGWTVDGSTWRLRLRLHPEDTLAATGQDGRAIELVTDSCRIELPESAGDPHPDLRALAAWLIVQPWAKRRVEFDRPVSAGFADAIHRGWEVEVGPVDPGLGPRAAGSVAGLSFSGGFDSTAVSAMLPADSPHLFFRRVPHPRVPNRASHIQMDVAERLVLQAGERGRRVQVVRSDLEFLTLPFPMLPTWTCFAIGLVLLADRQELGAVAFGTVLEARFLRNGLKFATAGPSAWQAPFELAGLPMLRPAAGMTEALTLRQAGRSGLGDLARSCFGGPGQTPCLACAKCLRKELLIAAAHRGRPTAELRRRIPASHRVARTLLDGEPPFYCQDMLEYALARADVSGTWLDRVRDRLAPTIEGTAWAERFYPAALDLEVPEPWRPTIERYVTEEIGFMTPDEVATVQTWDAAARAPRAAVAG